MGICLLSVFLFIFHFHWILNLKFLQVLVYHFCFYLLQIWEGFNAFQHNNSTKLSHVQDFLISHRLPLTALRRWSTQGKDRHFSLSLKRNWAQKKRAPSLWKHRLPIQLEKHQISRWYSPAISFLASRWSGIAVGQNCKIKPGQGWAGVGIRRQFAQFTMISLLFCRHHRSGDHFLQTAVEMFPDLSLKHHSALQWSTVRE